jgi:hypothetical protein
MSSSQLLIKTVIVFLISSITIHLNMLRFANTLKHARTHTLFRTQPTRTYKWLLEINREIVHLQICALFIVPVGISHYWEWPKIQVTENIIWNWILNPIYSYASSFVKRYLSSFTIFYWTASYEGILQCVLMYILHWTTDVWLTLYIIGRLCVMNW